MLKQLLSELTVVSLQYLHTSFDSDQTMNKFQRLRRILQQEKQNSIFRPFRIKKSFTLLEKGERQKSYTDSSESNFSIFPILHIVESSANSSDQIKSMENSLMFRNKNECKPYLRQKKIKNMAPYLTMRQNKITLNETVNNVQDMMTQSIRNPIRINKDQHNLNRHQSNQAKVQRQSQSKVSNINSNNYNEIKPKKKKISPKKNFSRAHPRSRRTLSLKRASTSPKQFDISAWETRPQLEFDLY